MGCELAVTYLLVGVAAKFTGVFWSCSVDLVGDCVFSCSGNNVVAPLGVSWCAGLGPLSARRYASERNPRWG